MKVPGKLILSLCLFAKGCVAIRFVRDISKFLIRRWFIFGKVPVSINNLFIEQIVLVH